MTRAGPAAARHAVGMRLPLPAVDQRPDPTVRGLVTSSLQWAADAPLPSGKTVGVWREDDPYNCNVFQTRDYIENVWGRFFDILEIRPLELGAQAVAVCRRPT